MNNVLVITLVKFTITEYGEQVVVFCRCVDAARGGGTHVTRLFGHIWRHVFEVNPS